MRVRPTRTIEMSKYHQDGKVVLAPLGEADMQDLQEEIATVSGAYKDENGAVKFSNPSSVYLAQALSRLRYIQSAPFPVTDKGFRDYLRMMDNTDFGSATEFREEIDKLIAELDDESSSPSQNSQEAGTESSE